MLNSSILLEINPQLDVLNDIYQNTSNAYRDSILSNYIRVAVADVYDKAADKSLFSMDIENLCDTDELRFQLGAGCFNFLQGLNYQDIDHALELAEDFGGVAHYLSDRVNTLDSVMIDSDRTRLSTIRCADKHNICHISEDIDQLKLPTGHYDLIVIGKFEALKLPRDSQQRLLERLRGSLSERGVLVINIKNQARISKWMDPENYSMLESIPFQDLYVKDQSLEYGRSQLSEALDAADFSAVDFYGCFSKGDGCQNLFSEDYLSSNSNALNHFYRLGSLENPRLNEYLFYKNLFDNDSCVFDLASRYVVVAGSDTKHTRQVYDNDFTHFAGQSRKARWRTVTKRTRLAAEVIKAPIHSQSIAANESLDKDVVKQNLLPQTFRKGRLLVGDWLDAVMRNDSRSLQLLVDEYAEWLDQLAAESRFNEVGYDLLPFNIIVSDEIGTRTLMMIDKEWQIDGDLSTDFVLFRALFWIAFQNKSIFQDFARQNGLSSIAVFVVRYLRSVSETAELQEFVDLEEKIQAQIDNNFRAKSVEHALLQSFAHEAPVSSGKPTCQLLWGNSSGVMDVANSTHVSWKPSVSRQKIRIPMQPFVAANPVLRVDPIAQRSLFSFSSIRALDLEGKVVWQLESSSAIIAVAEVQNAEFVDVKDGNDCFVALNDDPHFLFDLSQVKNIEKAHSLVVELALLHDASFDSPILTLTEVVNNQNISLVSQANIINEARAEEHYLKLRLDALIEQRAELVELLHNTRSNKADHVHELEQRISELHSQIVEQSERNHQLEITLLKSPVARVKRLFGRILERVI